MKSFIEKKSSNYNDRLNNIKPSMILIHATQMKNAEEALERLCDKNSGVSAHYFIHKSGEGYKLVDDEYCAWHAGKSCWKGNDDINDRSIGIELDNAWDEYTRKQLETLVGLLKNLCKKHKINSQNVWGHSDVSPHRKEDPGVKFPWKWLSDSGFGFNTEEKNSSFSQVSEQEAKEILKAIGYNSLGNRAYLFKDILLAFQRHFIPSNCTSELDTLTQKTLLGVKRH